MQWLLWLLVLQVSVSLHSLSPDLHPEFGMAVVSHWKSPLSARRRASLPRICEVAQHVGVYAFVHFTGEKNGTQRG